MDEFCGEFLISRTTDNAFFLSNLIDAKQHRNDSNPIDSIETGKELFVIGFHRLYKIGERCHRRALEFPKLAFK